MKGDLFIRDLWMQGTDIIHNTRVVNTDATSYQSQTPEKCLETTVKGEKVSQRLPKTASALHYLHNLSGRLSLGHGESNTETYFQPPHNKLEGIPLTDLRVCEE